MNKKEATKKYGKVALKKMHASGWLDGITVTENDKGEIDIPESDYERAFMAIKGKRISNWD